MEGVRCVGVNLKRYRPFLKLGAGRAVPCAGWGGRQVCFRRDSPPPPSPVPAALVSRPGCCPREGFPLLFLLHFPLRFRGHGRKIGEVVCSLATSLGAGDPEPCLGTTSAPPAQQILSWPCASTPPFPAASRAVLGPDVSLAFSPPKKPEIL